MDFIVPEVTLLAAPLFSRERVPAGAENDYFGNGRPAGRPADYFEMSGEVQASRGSDGPEQKTFILATE